MTVNFMKKKVFYDQPLSTQVGCVTLSVNSWKVTSLVHRHKEMEEQFAASVVADPVTENTFPL